MVHSLCVSPFAPFTTQHAGSTTSPTIVLMPVVTPPLGDAAPADAVALAGAAAVADIVGIFAGAFAGVADIVGILAGAFAGASVLAGAAVPCATASGAKMAPDTAMRATHATNARNDFMPILPVLSEIVWGVPNGISLSKRVTPCKEGGF